MARKHEYSSLLVADGVIRFRSEDGAGDFPPAEITTERQWDIKEGASGSRGGVLSCGGLWGASGVVKKMPVLCNTLLSMHHTKSPSYRGTRWFSRLISPERLQSPLAIMELFIVDLWL